MIDSQYFISNSEPHIKSEVVNLMTERWEVSPNWNDKYQIFVPHEKDILENLVFTNVLRLKFRVIQKLVMENLTKMKETTNPEEADKLFTIHSELKKSEMELANALGIVITK